MTVWTLFHRFSLRVPEIERCFIHQKIIIEHEVDQDVVHIINLDMDYYTIAIKCIFLGHITHAIMIFMN